jgi:predicted transposase YbfD/YdcC
VIAVCAVICAADDFVAIAEFGRMKREWLARFLDLPSGIPSHDRCNAILAAIHMVSAWATANHISLGQVVVDAKSNEITAIPKLLQILEISGCLVTIDALGCQTEIAQEIVTAGADYVLAVKGNQPTLQQGIKAFFDDHREDDFARTKARRYETQEKGPGREENRSYVVCPVAEDLPDGSRWAKLHSQQISLGTRLCRGGA